MYSWRATFPRPPIRVLIVLATGLAVTAASVLLFAWWLRLPVHGRCPECGASTAALSPDGWLRPMGDSLWVRWCPGCTWKGLARRGPDLSEGPVDHGSGFRWGDARLPRDMGFRWAHRPPPSHPSGFRWGADPGGHPTPSGTADGVRLAWPAGAPDGMDRSFRWAEPRNPDVGFRFRAPGVRGSGFRWGGGDPPDAGAPTEQEGPRWADPEPDDGAGGGAGGRFRRGGDPD